MVEDRLRPRLADGPSDRPIEIRDDPFRRAIERCEERLPTLHVLAALDLDQARLHGRFGRVHRDEDRARFEVAGLLLVGRVRAGADLCRSGWPIAARHEGGRVEDHDARPGPPVERLDHADRVGVEVVDRERRLLARLARADAPEVRLRWIALIDAKDRVAQFPARVAEAHALAHSKEQPGDLLMSEDEAAAGLHALVALEDVLAVRAGLPRVGVVRSRLTDRNREGEGVSPGLRGEHTAVARPALGWTPPAPLIAVEPHSASRMVWATRSDDPWVEWRACHAAIVLVPPCHLRWHKGPVSGRIPTQIQQGARHLRARHTNLSAGRRRPYACHAATGGRSRGVPAPK